MIDQTFIEALVDLAEEQGSDASIIQLRDQARDKVLSGGGEITAVVNSSSDGKSAGLQLAMDSAKLFSCAQLALRRYRGDEVTLTYADFSGVS
jgi:hypothetical protein